MAVSDILVNFLSQLKAQPDAILFSDSMKMIESIYDFQPTAFSNGYIHNSADQNQGSCKLFAFGQLHQLTESEVLACCGEIYRDEVLVKPEADNHSNIRAFMKTGWSGVSFESMPLMKKSS